MRSQGIGYRSRRKGPEFDVFLDCRVIVFEDKAVVEKRLMQYDRVDGFTFYPDLLQNGPQRNAVVADRQRHERPGRLNFSKFPPAGVLAHGMVLLITPDSQSSLP